MIKFYNWINAHEKGRNHNFLSRGLITIYEVTPGSFLPKPEGPID